MVGINPNSMDPEFVLHGTGDLAEFLGGSSDSFTGQLLNLYAKADSGNKRRLAESFPLECRAYEVWRTTEVPSVENLATALGRS